MADRHDAGEVERARLAVDRVPAAGRRELDEVVDPRSDVLERVGPAAAVAEPAVLEVPRRQAVRDEVLAQRAHQLAAEAGAPEAAVYDHRHGDRFATRRPEQLAELRPADPVGVVLGDHSYAVTPSERAAAASRVMPSSICSGVTPE